MWSWIHESKDALVVARSDEPEAPVGIAHLRSWVRPLRGERAGYLDDLFIEPDARGQGTFEELFEAIRQKPREESCGLVRWTTAEDNFRARSAYGRVASRTDWVTYDMAVEGSGAD